MQTNQAHQNPKKNPIMEKAAVSNLTRPFRQLLRDCPEHGEWQQNAMIDGAIRYIAGCPVCIKHLQLKALMRRNVIPQKFANKSLESYQPENDRAKQILAASVEYANHFKEKMRTCTCLVFCGEFGTGKTHLACSIANAVMKQGHSALYVTTSDLVKTIRSAWSDRSVSEIKIIKTFAEPDLLVLDEVGRNRGTADEKNTLFDVMDKRYSVGRPSIVISNRDKDGVKAYLGAAAFDRLKEGGGQYFVFDWESYRSKA